MFAVEARLPGRMALRSLEFRPPAGLRLEPVVRIGERRVSLPLRMHLRWGLSDLGLAFRAEPPGKLSGIYWLRTRLLAVRCEKFPLRRLGEQTGTLDGRLEVRLDPPARGDFEVTARLPDLVLMRAIPGFQTKMTLRRVQARGRLKDRRVTVRDARFRGADFRAGADVDLELRSPPASSTVRLKVRLEEPTRRRYEQTSTLGQLLELLQAG